MYPRAAFGLLTLVIMFLQWGGAKADQTQFGAELLCDTNANRAMIVFATVKDSEPLPGKIPAIPTNIEVDASLLSPAPGNFCQFADGREIKVKTNRDPITSFGYCGVSPPDWFSMWIDRRKIWSREVYNTCERGFTHRAVIINGKRLFDCIVVKTTEEANARSWWQLPNHVDCADVSARLSQSKIDLVEYPPMGPPMPPIGTVLATDVADRELCQVLADLQTEQTEGYAYTNVDRDLWPLGPPPPMGQGQAFKPVSISHVEATDRLDYRVDLDNDGNDDYVEIVSRTDNFFYGNYIVLMPSSDPLSDDLRRAQHFGRAKEAIKLLHARGYRTYSGTDTPYGRNYLVSFFPFQLRGRTYLWAYTLWGQENPMSIFYQLNRSGQLDLLCSFWRVQENY